MIEPPTMVINTVLSVMAYDYPPEKTSVYLSDDGCSDLTFYALLEASQFSKKWLPFCRKFNVEPRSPEAYFKSAVESLDDSLKRQEWVSMKVSLSLSLSLSPVNMKANESSLTHSNSLWHHFMSLFCKLILKSLTLCKNYSPFLASKWGLEAVASTPPHVGT